MTDEHKHVWAAAGCWCGAQRCEFKTPREVPRPAAQYYAGAYVPRKAKKVVPLTDRCREAAEPGEIYCVTHVLQKPTFGGAA